ncbi:alpha/beta fold hydrolase [Brachybacterium sp. FME24]|uniref:alpha/beta fold hydrolase n=1 Tax=Brachybacterium sp. FME24 TaxID=2742605 RepID=UPI0018692DA1|nr:alpha/beta fold hydrolase [Brachybacterium sp. FME24]
MAARLGRFTDAAAAARYREAYDALAAHWPAEADELHVPTAFGDTFVRRAPGGDGPPLVLLHGLEGTSLSWAPFLEELTSGRTVLAPDTLGTAGRSTQTAPIRTEADRARWLDETLDGLGEDRVHLLGYSNGCASVLAALIHRPQRIAGAVLIEPMLARPPLASLARFMVAGAIPTHRRMDRMSRWLTPGVDPGPEELALATASRRSYRTALPWPAPPTPEELAGIRAPVLVQMGQESVLSNPDAAEELARRHLPRASVHRYDGLGHGLLHQAPQRVLPDVQEHLRRADAD